MSRDRVGVSVHGGTKGVSDEVKLFFFTNMYSCCPRVLDTKILISFPLITATLGVLTWSMALMESIWEI